MSRSLFADLLSVNVRRRVRQREGDSDLEGLLGWSIEVKRAKESRLPEWWRQTVAQAEKSRWLPVLFYRLDGKSWRAVWPIAALAGLSGPTDDLSLTAESSVEAWAVIYRASLPIGESGEEPELSWRIVPKERQQ